MDKFLKYFENERFVRWVMKPNEQLDEYWKDYIEKRPIEKKSIDLARLLVSQVRPKKEQGIRQVATDLFSKIVQEIDNRNKKFSIRKLGISALKYSAAALIFLLISIALFYVWQPDRFAEVKQLVIVVEDQNNAQLILSDGKNISISQKESKIEYQDDGIVVINSDDTIQSVTDLQIAEMNQLIVPYGKNSSIRLPDGSVAYLNAGSRLIYPSNFVGKKREVYLIGEAFFEVSYAKDMPFTVQTNDVEVEVLGTKFNLSAYPSDKTIETVLVEGKIRVKKSGFRFIHKAYVLEPNQMVVFNRQNSETKIVQVDVLNYVSWHDGYLNFASLDLIRIIKKLERYYNIQIRLDDPMMGTRAISGKLKLKEDKEFVLKILAKTATAELIKLNESTYIIK